MTDLTNLIGWLEAASEGGRELDDNIARAVMSLEDAEAMRFAGITPNYSRSLDAALMLVPEGRDYLVRRINGRSFAMISGSEPGRAPTPALALCIAALRSMGT